MSATAKAFLGDLAASGGGILFIDSLEMFTEPGRRRTVNDFLREASTIEGFSVIATARSDFGKDGESWLAEDALAMLGGAHIVTVGELQDTEVEILTDHAPTLRALLAVDHPAAPIARNLYRLSRLLKVPSAAAIRTEAALADYWWRTADGAPETEVRAAQRILADLADIALIGEDVLEVRSDSAARSHLLQSLTLREVRRDHLGFYHDVLRDWAVGNRIHENPSRIATFDLSIPVSPRIARGVEFAGRLALEMQSDCNSWLQLLALLSPAGAHGSWRRQALLAIVRSELASSLLERCSGALLAQGGALLRELCTAIVAVETIAVADLLKSAPQNEAQAIMPRSLRTNTTGSATWMLLWCVAHVNEIPLQAISATIDLVEIQYFALMRLPPLAEPVARMLFRWLRQLDVRATNNTIPIDESAGRLDRQAYDALVGDLRMWSLLLAGHAVDDAKAYLGAVTAERDMFKAQAIRQFSSSLAPVAPAELAYMVASSLIQPEERKSARCGPLERAFSFADSDYLPPSPAQPPFLDLLEASPEIGLALIRQLTQEAVGYNSRSGADADANGFTLVFESGPRFFPWTQTYFWSRDQAREYSVASGLKALEAWGHARLDAGERVELVLADILGPEGSCAAYLLVAVDLLISHWPATREVLVPFLACPELLATERGREVHDQLGRPSLRLGREPSGKVQLADLAARPSRGIPLERALVGYLADDAVSNRLRAQLKVAVDALGAFGEHADFGDPAFMGAHALNTLNPENWIEVKGGRAYRSPPAEAEHIKGLSSRSVQLLRSSEIEAKIQLAIGDATRGSSELAREALDHAAGNLLDDGDADASKRRSTQLIAAALLVARDGDDSLLDAQEHWVRAMIDRALSENSDRHEGSGDVILFNRPALAACALAHLWHRKRMSADRDALIAIATRPDRSAPTAFAAALNVILSTDSRLLKAAMRAAFASCRWRWHPWDEDTSIQERFEEEKAAADARAVAAEVAWLEGGPEPEWPIFPEESPAIRPHIRLPDSGEQPYLGGEDADSHATSTAGDAKIQADSQTAARWLKLLTARVEPAVAWRDEIVDTYAAWSARINGFGLPPETEVNERNSDWNNQFYTLLGISLMDASPPRFEKQLQQVTGLPDRAFVDAAEALIHAADVTYFNDVQQTSERAVELRTQLVQRTQNLHGWTRRPRPGDLSVEREIVGVVAKLLMNTYNPFSQTQSYLVPAVFDRVDPLLDPLRSLLPSGPTPFVALCTMNMLLVAPRARHIDFLLSGAEAWLERFPRDQAMWLTLGIGSKIVDWFEKVIVEEPGLLGRDHSHSAGIDAVLGRLVDLGVPEAHEMEQRIESERCASGKLKPD